MALAQPDGTSPRPRVTFWFGCNMLRHAEIIRLSMLLLEKAGYDVEAAGGPAYCCGTPHDATPGAQSTMAARTVDRFNTAAAEDGRETVVTWCPSCHMHMADIMAPGNASHFGIAHITELLAAAADRLRPLLTHPVKRRVLLHQHMGFESHVAVNDRVAEILKRIPGLELVEGPRVPGHMCSSLASVPGALKKAQDATWHTAATHGCDTIATIFHSCHREMVARDGQNGLEVRNWVHLVAEAMGLAAEDAYRTWRKGGEPGADAIARADPRLYAKLVDPELKKLAQL
ncbi:MAG: heterodisulfide reductase-related iron-sulfur binding cluster [Hyphomicrobiaceae bacterium]